MKETYITIKVYHDEIGNEDLQYMARQAAERMADDMWTEFGIDVKVRIDPDDVAVHTTPFKVE